MRRFILRLFGVVTTVVVSGLLATSAESDVITVTKCTTYTRYTNPDPTQCVAVYIANGPGSPAGSSQTIRVTWSSGAISSITAPANPDPWMFVCKISNITVHETSTPTSISTRTP